MRSHPTASQTSLADRVPEDLFITKTLNLQTGEPEAKRQEILTYFNKTFSLYESLFECLRDDAAFYARANPLRHPLIFYYGHTAVFFVNKLNVAGLIQTRIDPVLESSLAVGVDEMSWDDLNDSDEAWPSPEAVKAYRDKTRVLVDNFIRRCDFTLPINPDSPLWIVMMGIEHERIHLETSSVLIRELPLCHVQSHPLWDRPCPEAGPAPKNEMIPVKGGVINLGKERDGPFYGWDNEYGRYTETVGDFAASKFLVSNAEFRDFVNADGYHTQKYWSAEGWAWREYQTAEHPRFWVPDGDTFKYRTLLSEISMPWNWPVDINYLEAKAFCAWKGETSAKSIRMPTEAEWQTLRSRVETDQPYWDVAPGNLNLEHGPSACPVNRHEFSDGFFDLIGNVWQWTETPIDGYAGFAVHPAYDDFSTPTFDGKHNLIKGGSWMSTGNSALKDSRYAFRRHFLQHSGLRYVEAAPLPEPQINRYETDGVIARYIDFHYGKPLFGVLNFAVTAVEAIKPYLQDKKKGRALDIGCAAGRASFELAKIYDHVDGVDLSVRLIEAPSQLQKTGAQRYVVPQEGELRRYKDVRLSNFEGYAAVASKISFLQGDACNLADKFTNYDLVFASNVLDRLYDPAKFLNLMKDRIASGGVLVILSPYSWDVAYTPRDKWLGGFKAKTGESYSTLQALEDHLTPEFERLDDPKDIAFIMRDTARTFTQGLSELTLWQKI